MPKLLPFPEGLPLFLSMCPKLSKKSTSQKNAEPVMESQKSTQITIPPSSPPSLAKFFAKMTATPSAPSPSTPPRQQSSKEDFPPFLTRILGNAASTRHPDMLKKILTIAIDALPNKDITGAFLELLPVIRRLMEKRQINKFAILPFWALLLIEINN
ncbi:hypothetical protein ILUMI_16133 [Ignelater luminosus]|uniref:Uncharacterized protein n=1 Tax=Ignelater luminosus TaxID=2038154 RepID=A0A8K0G367_IGNLU|nr:hypothetical protein ILUMI_16133 [Ignelater luminosus]